jgi:deazaflavin-dependent oxidoreductase (nitroreductase family)
MSGEWLARHAADDFCYLTTVGRKTGNPHEIEIWFAVDQPSDPAGQPGTDVPTLYMMAGGRQRADWVRNLMKTPQVTIRIGAEKHQGIARVLDAREEPELDARVRRLLATKYREWADGQEGRELSGWARSALLVEVRFIPSAGSP